MDNLYSSIVESFWREDNKKHFSPCERIFFFYLLEAWRVSEHEHPFPCSSSIAERDLDMPRKTIIECRKKLQKRGVINFQEGEKKAKNPYYYFNEVTKRVTLKVTKEVTKNVTLTDSVTKVSPIPPSKDNIYNNKETSSNEEVKKETKKKKRDSVKDLPDCEVIDEAKNERMDWKAFETFYNNTVASKLPQINGVTDKRRKLVKAVIKTYGKDSIAKVMNFVINSPWHTGINNRGWTADIDWIFNPNNYVRLLDKARNYGASTNQNCGGNHINSGAVQDQPINIYKEVFGYDGAPENFEEWFNKHPYGS